MKAISIGSRYEIYDDTLKAYDSLPAQTYTVCFSQMTGFFLKVRPDLVVKEPVYGVHPEKAEKVLRSFKRLSRALRLTLSPLNRRLYSCLTSLTKPLVAIMIPIHNPHF